MTKLDLKNYCQRLLNFFTAQWQLWKPAADKAIRAMIAIVTIASTFKFVLQTIPIVVSILTVLATLPLVSYLFPSFFFTTSLNSTLIFSIIGVISIFVGYSKYQELILRKELDAQTKQSKEDIEILQAANNLLNQRVERLEALVSQPTFLPSRPSLINDPSSSYTIPHAEDVSVTFSISECEEDHRISSHI